MDIFRSVTQTVLGTQQMDTQPSGAETVERLLDRVQSSTLLEDRRDGCRALKSLSRKYRLLVGAHGMDTLIQVLEMDRSDHEIVNYALETLVNVTSDEDFSKDIDENDAEAYTEPNDKMGVQFTEIFIKRTENIALIVGLLDEFDFKIRFPSMKLLSNLLQNKPKDLQEAILVTPSAVSKLMDMLSDSREVIRNDTLLLLTSLTQGNTNLQKIVVFENAFDHLFSIIQEEGFSEGSVVAEDCIILMLNLLRNNPSNQMLFKEGSYIEKMQAFFNLSPEGEDITWSPQKIAIVHYMLKLLRTLVSPQNPSEVVASCQRKMKVCGHLEQLCILLMASGVPSEILTDTIVTVAEVIRGNKDNQEFFSTVMAPSNPPRPIVVVLLMSMANEKQPFNLRCAVLYCFQSYLYRNPSSQAQIVATLLPQTTEVSQVTSGHLLCGGLFSPDPLSNWFSAVALSHALLDNSSQKEQLLRVQLSTGEGDSSVSLLQQCAMRLQAGSDVRTRFGLLQLLCTWLSHCPVAATHLLNLSAVIPNLTAYLSASEHDELEALCQGLCAFLLGLCVYFNEDSSANFPKRVLTELLVSRVGAEAFTDKVDGILRSEAYSAAAKAPQLKTDGPAKVVFDHEFTKLYKTLEGPVLRSVVRHEENDAEAAELKRLNGVVESQEKEIERLRRSLGEAEAKAAAASKGGPGLDSHPVQINGVNGTTVEPSSDLRQQLSEMTYARDYYYYQMMEKDALLQQLQQNKATEANGDASEPEIANLRKQLEDLQLVLYKKDEELEKAKSSQGLLSANKTDAFISQFKELEVRVREKDAEIQRIQSSDAVGKSLALEKAFGRLQSEQEDLLVLLSDQESKIVELKKRLVRVGEVVSDDDQDEDDEVVDEGLDLNKFDRVSDSASDEFSLA